MKKFIMLLVLLLLVAAAGLGAPYVIGGIAEQQMGGVVSWMAQNANMQVKRTSFRRGLFSSTATYEISFNMSDGKKLLDIPMRSVIHHGPFAGTLREVSITSTPVLSPEYKMKLAPMFGDKPPFTVVATRSNAGGWKIAFHSPSFDVQEKNQSMQWQGVEALTTVHGNKVVFKAHMPGGMFSGTGADMAIGAITMSAHGEMRPHRSTLANFTFDASADSLAINNAAGGNDKSIFAAKGLRLHERLEPAVAGALSYGATLSADDLNIGHHIHATHPKLTMRTDGIDQAATEKLSASLEALKRKHLKPEDLQRQMFAALNALWPAFLARSPKATVAFDAGRLTVQSEKAGEGPLFVADGFHASEQFQAGSNQTLAYGLEFSADTLKAHGQTPVTEAKVGLRLEHVYWGFIKELVPQFDALEKKHLAPALLQQREQALFAMHLPDILSHSPSLRLTALRFTSASGTLKGDGKATFDGSGNLNLGDRAAVIDRLNAHLDLEVDAPLARAITLAALTAWSKKAAQQSGKPQQTVNAQMADGMLENLRRQGLLISDGVQYGSRVDLKDAEVYVNGTMVVDLSKMTATPGG